MRILSVIFLFAYGSVQNKSIMEYKCLCRNMHIYVIKKQWVQIMSRAKYNFVTVKECDNINRI